MSRETCISRKVEKRDSVPLTACEKRRSMQGMDAQKLTREQAAIISLYTGTLAGPFEDMHRLAEKLHGSPIWTHQLASKEFADQLAEKCKPLFLALCAEKAAP